MQTELAIQVQGAGRINFFNLFRRSFSFDRTFPLVDEEPTDLIVDLPGQFDLAVSYDGADVLELAVVALGVKTPLKVQMSVQRMLKAQKRNFHWDWRGGKIDLVVTAGYLNSPIL